MLCYPATLEQDAETGTYIVGFADIPFAHAVGVDPAEALSSGGDALATAFGIFVERGEPIPAPTPPRVGQPVVMLPVVMAGKVALYSAMREAGLYPDDLARRLNIAPSIVQRLLSFRHHSRIEQIETALAMLDRRLVVEVVKAA